VESNYERIEGAVGKQSEDIGLCVRLGIIVRSFGRTGGGSFTILQEDGRRQ